tara:strand:+ start:458 stop:1057 length:600 start_codon:yes stop_codon:yes gene_type:complete
MRNKLIAFILLFIFSLSSSIKAEEDFALGVDLGIGFLDIGAQETAQSIANSSGSTVTYAADTGTWLARLYTDVEIAESLYIDVGFFLSGSIDAKYTLSGVTATEGYSANGIDASLVLKEGDKEGFFIKGGIHSSTVDGKASITISGTTYAANAASSGTGFLFGGGYDFADSSRIGYTFYSDLGGLSKADLAYIYYGYRF